MLILCFGKQVLTCARYKQASSGLYLQSNTARRVRKFQAYMVACAEYAPPQRGHRSDFFATMLSPLSSAVGYCCVLECEQRRITLVISADKHTFPDAKLGYSTVLTLAELMIVHVVQVQLKLTPQAGLLISSVPELGSYLVLYKFNLPLGASLPLIATLPSTNKINTLVGLS